MPDKIKPNSRVETHLTKDVPVFPVTSQVSYVKTNLHINAHKFRDFNYVYFNDHSGKLAGYLSLKQLFELPGNALVSAHLNKDTRHCYPNTTMARAVFIAFNHDLLDIPILDHDGKLQGVLTADTLLKVTASLFEETMTRQGGVLSHRSLYDLALSGSVSKIFMARLPWILLGTIGGLISAHFLGLFEHVLQSNILLALFIPAVVYLSGAAGIQSETLFIRTLALKDNLKLSQYMIKDMSVTFLLGLVIASVLFVTTYLWKQDLPSTIVISLTMLVNVTLASPVYLLIPITIRKFGKDPAMGSGPLATIVQDLVSLVVYFIITLVVFYILGIAL